MEEQITILNVLKYEKDGKSGCRLSFIYSDDSKKDNSKNFKGHAELSLFYDAKVFDKVPLDAIGDPVVGTFKEIKDLRNPLKSRLVLEKIETDEAIISLL